MSVNLNPSSILPSSDSPVIDFKGDKKYLKIAFAQRSLDSDTLGLLSDTPNATATLGEIIAFETFGNKQETKNVISNSKLTSNNDKKNRLKFHLGLFLYGDAPKKSSTTISVIELKYYYLNMKFDKKPISLSEGISFIKAYIIKSFKSDSEALLDYALESDFDALANNNVMFLKESFKNPTITNFNRFEKEFLSDRNPKLQHFKSFYEKYDISNIRNVKKIVDIKEIIARMQTIDDRKFN
jgi:hypothetical protein